MHAIESGIDIEAPPGRVWAVLMDFPHYPEWNPFVSRISGTPLVGGRLDLRLTPPGGMAMTLKPTVVSVEPERQFGWLGHLLARGLFAGEHIFELHEGPPGSVRFVQRERLTGLLVPLLLLMARKSTQRGFEAMNRALKQRAESDSV